MWFLKPALFAVSPELEVQGREGRRDRMKGRPLLICITVAGILKWLLMSTLKLWSFPSQTSLALKLLPFVILKAAWLYFLFLLSTPSCWCYAQYWPWAGVQFSHWCSAGRIVCSDEGQGPWTPGIRAHFPALLPPHRGTLVSLFDPSLSLLIC